MISTHRFDAGRLARVVVREGDFVEWLHAPINDTDCVAGFAEFHKGSPEGSFVLWYDEIQYGIHGEADLFYRLPPVYDNEFVVRVNEGDLYFLPIGSEVRFQVVGDEPYRALYAVMPRPKFFGDVRQWTLGHKEAD